MDGIELRRKYDLERLCGDMRAWTEVIQRFRHKGPKPSPQECTERVLHRGATFHGLCGLLAQAATARNISDPVDFVNLMGRLTDDNTSRAIDSYNRLALKVESEVFAEFPGPVTTYTASPKGFVAETVHPQWPRPELPGFYIKTPDGQLESPNWPPPVSHTCKHSPDFATVIWFGTSYQFTINQGRCVAALWQEWEKGKLGLHEKTIGESVNPDSDAFRLLHVFRTHEQNGKKRTAKMHDAWGKMIVPAGKGIFRLSEPKKF